MHRKIEFDMPADAAVVFDAFHYHRWRPRWDSLVQTTEVQGGAPCPSVGAVSDNGGAGWLRLLSMRTRFVSYERPQLAAAVMEGIHFPFRRWAASMRHVPTAPGRSRMVYTYTLETSVWLEPLVSWAFERSTRKRFTRLQAFLADHADEVVHWQLTQRHATALTEDRLL